MKQSDSGLTDRGQVPLESHIHSALECYFENLAGHATCDLYRLVMAEVERPLLEVALKHADGNQTRAAKVLGINRATLRKKLRQYGIE